MNTVKYALHVLHPGMAHTCEQGVEADAAAQQRSACAADAAVHDTPDAHANHRPAHERWQRQRRQAQDVVAGTARIVITVMQVVGVLFLFSETRRATGSEESNPGESGLLPEAR